MTTRAQDWRTFSLLEPVPQNPREVAGGVSAAVGIPVLILLVILITGVLQDWWGTRARPELEPLPVMQTRFVRLGRPDTTALPMAQPAAKTVKAEEPPVPDAPPPKPDTTPAVALPTEKKKPAEKQDTRSTDEMLDQLNKSADAISKLSQSTESHGDAEGIAQGTVSRADADIYLGKLYEYFRRGWIIPSSITDADLQKLVCTIEVTISEDARVDEYQISRSSGNDAFDQSVLDRLEQALGAPLPPPPKESEERFLNQTISLRFFGKNAR